MVAEIITVAAGSELERSTPPSANQLARAIASNGIVEFPVKHTFAPGIYVREITVPAGGVILGHVHKTDCVNILLKGRATLLVGRERMEVSAPLTFVSKAGTQKAALVHEEMVWLNIHPTEEADLAKIESLFIEESSLAELYNRRAEEIQ